MTALSHGWSVLLPKDIGCNRNISISDIWFQGKLCRIGTFENEEQVIFNRNYGGSFIFIQRKGKMDQLDKAAAILVF